MSPMNIFWAQMLLATDILKTMDQTAKPCDDFYQFACGNYRSGIVIKPDTPRLLEIFEMYSTVAKQLRKVLEIPIKRDDPESTQLAKNYYQSCMNVMQLEKLELTPLKSLIDSLGGWPVLLGDKWKGEADYDWVKMASRAFRDFGQIAFFIFNIIPMSSTKKILWIGKIPLYLETRDHYLDRNKTEHLNAFRRYMLETALQLGADRKTAERDVEDVIVFETELAKIAVDDVDNSSTPSYLGNVSMVKETHSDLPLDTFFSDLSENGWKLNDSMGTYVNCSTYLTALPEVLNKTKKRTIANYQIWKILDKFISRLAPSLKNHYNKFINVTTSYSWKDKERWEECVTRVQNELSEATSAIYVKHYYDEEQKQKVERIAADIKWSMTKLIIEATWMDSSTKTAALIKLEKMIGLFGFPAYIFNETVILRDIKGIKIDRDQYFANAVSLSTRIFRASARSLDETTMRTDWDKPTHDIGAYYSFVHNTLLFPAAFLQYPMFASYAPNYINYGRIGSVIGHEISHSLDNTGHLRDSEGAEVKWWANDTLEIYLNKTQCFIDQYGSIVDSISGEKINGELTLGDNIADNNAIKLAYQTYNRWTSAQPSSEPILHNLDNYTAEQLFFISYGQTWCQHIGSEPMKALIKRDDHAPNKYRINIPLGNFDVFAETFKCPYGSFMNPVNKCVVW